ncbi:MAG: prolyl oligopeptidase family serine peptidase, partial [Bradymonadaceae bacterium]
GVLPPENYTVGRKYGLVMSLHGAGVDAAGQVTSYSPKEWAWVIAPTNRRKFGFNWEEWGRFNGLKALEDAKQTWAIDNSRVHITGHSMGGHGTWHLGVHDAGQFATIVPSAGWESIYSYPPGGSSDRPPGTRGRARAHSDTKEYLSNIADRSVYLIHGTADNNVPTDEGRKMCKKAKNQISTDANVECHFEEGAEHWWDGNRAEGTDCVDWPPAWKMMKNRTLDPHALEFSHKTPGPWYGAEHSYVKIDSSETPMKDVELTSTKTGESTVKLTTNNARSLEIDGKALKQKGIQTINVDGNDHSVP